MPRDFYWNIKVRCDIYNHSLVEDFYGHDILSRLKPNERQFVNDMTMYNKAPRYIMGSLKDENIMNLASVRQVYKARDTYHSTIRAPFTKIEHLLGLINPEKYM